MKTIVFYLSIIVMASLVCTQDVQEKVVDGEVHKFKYNPDYQAEQVGLGQKRNLQGSPTCFKRSCCSICEQDNECCPGMVCVLVPGYDGKRCYPLDGHVATAYCMSSPGQQVFDCSLVDHVLERNCIFSSYSIGSYNHDCSD